MKHQLIIPWLATLLFGLAVFVVGKVFQAREKRQRQEAKDERERAELAKLVHLDAQEQRPQGIMAAIGGQGQRQRSGRRVHSEKHSARGYNLQLSEILMARVIALFELARINPPGGFFFNH